MYGARDGCRPHVPSVEDWYTNCCSTQAWWAFNLGPYGTSVL